MNKNNNIVYHESAFNHVTGKSVYVDDIQNVGNLLYGKVVFSPYAHARIISVNTEKAKKLKGVKAVLTYKDIPGMNNFGPVVHDEVCLAESKVEFIGQAVCIIAAETAEIAREAENLIKIEYRPLDAILDIETAIKTENLIAPQRKIERGDIITAFKNADNVIEGSLNIGGQEHWYLETQSCLCIPDEEYYKVYSSTQNPSETQLLVAEVLGLKSHNVEVEVKRMGGAFGGKETQANHYACWSALLSMKTQQPVKIVLNRDDDQKTTGKRHPFLVKYKAAYTNQGMISAIDVELNCNAGSSTDLTMAILERAMLHTENVYFIPDIKIIGRAYKTNMPSNTAFRGFGGPQGMAVIETVIDRIARNLEKDAAEIRFKNFYGTNERNTTPYGQVIENNRVFAVYNEIINSSDYYNRRKLVDDYNKNNKYEKKGLALTPVKFGISFTTAFLNQAGALVHIYKDGSVMVNHGGTEMGQGLHTKISQIAAAELGVTIDKIIVTATNTSKVPNTSPTAASSGTDINGMAVKNAIEKLKKRLSVVATHLINEQNDISKTKPEDIKFEKNIVSDKRHKHRKIKFDELVAKAYLQQTSLSATGFYKTPDIHFDRIKGTGKPFHYFSYAIAVSEVKIDVLTGEMKILRTDIVFDIGNPINKLIDLGQIEGGFIQGVGWCTSEELKYDEKGNLLNHSPDTYKIPLASNIPEDFRVRILDGIPNHNTIRRSKAIGEPPFMLAFSVWLAIKDAISYIANHKIEPQYQIPATNETILLAIEKMDESK